METKLPSCLLLLTLAAGLNHALAQTYSLDWFTLDGGGGQSTDGYYTITGTIGQPDAGQLSDGYYTIQGGFWSVLATMQTPGAPGLTIERTATNSLIVSWPATWDAWHLQQCPDLRANYWTDVSTPPQPVDGRMQVVVYPITGTRFYRLVKVATPPVPSLAVALTATNSVVISWPAPAEGWQLQQNAALSATNWSNVSTAPQPLGGRLQVVVAPPVGNRFYRLSK